MNMVKLSEQNLVARLGLVENAVLYIIHYLYKSSQNSTEHRIEKLEG